MRSVFALLRETTEAEVVAYLDRTYPSQSGPPWVQFGSDGPSLYIDFYRDLNAECEPEEYADLTHQFGGEPAIAVMADVSGWILGYDQAFEFLVGLLGQFSGVAMDDYSSHLWSLDELQAGHRDGRRSFRL